MERPGGNWMNRVGLLLALAILAAAPAAAHAKTLRCRTFLPKSSGVWVGKITAHNVGCSYADGLAVVIALQPPGYPLPSTIHAGNGAWQVHSSRARSARSTRPFLHVAIRHRRQVVTFNLHR